VGNVLEYRNTDSGYETEQTYSYDGLYQLGGVRGQSVSKTYGPVGYRADYEQAFSFDRIGNMTGKVSTAAVNNGSRVGAELNYDFEYAYYAGYAHRAERIGNRYYTYDGNGNVVTERDGGHAQVNAYNAELYNDGRRYYTDYGFGLGESGEAENEAYRRDYTWDERNLMTESRDGQYTVRYRYGADGQRAVKYVAGSGDQTLYYNTMWQVSRSAMEWRQSKHIFVGETRLATKVSYEGNNTADEKERIYYYHSDHLGSAQVVTNYEGELYERFEYAPYGEVWIDWVNMVLVNRPDKTPFRFTGKEQDEETGLYYYGARYLDPRTSRWLSADPAMGEYIPVAPINDEARRRNGNLPGMGGVFNYVNLHVYHYAGNNPVKYTDPDGRDAYNCTGEDIYVRNEEGTLFPVRDGEMYKGRIDGIITNDGTVIKVSDTDKYFGMLPTVDITVDKENGEYGARFTNMLSMKQNDIGDTQKKGTDLNLSGIYTKEYVEGLKSGFDSRWKIDEIEANPQWVRNSSANIMSIDPILLMGALVFDGFPLDNNLKKRF
jgi:RHS repeat-associated protein